MGECWVGGGTSGNNDRFATACAAPFVGGSRHFVDLHGVVSGGSPAADRAPPMTTRSSRARLLVGAALLLPTPALAQATQPAPSDQTAPSTTQAPAAIQSTQAGAAAQPTDDYAVDE